MTKKYEYGVKEFLKTYGDNRQDRRLFLVYRRSKSIFGVIKEEYLSHYYKDTCMWKENPLDGIDHFTKVKAEVTLGDILYHLNPPPPKKEIIKEIRDYPYKVGEE